jgi:hypothetical protein
MKLLGAALVGLLTFGVFTPWPRPTVALRGVCEPVAVGRFGFECDLAGLAQRTGRKWVQGDVRLYEDGVLLRAADRAGDVRRQHAGSFHTSGDVLSFSALDGGDVRTNGRAYDLRPAPGGGPFGMTAERARAGIAVLLALVLVIAWVRRRSLGWEWIGMAALAAAIGGVAIQCLNVFGETLVNVDAGYFLPSAEAVRAGGRPYTQLFYAYTPLGLYELAAWSRLWVFGDLPPYNWYLALIVLVEAGCAALVYVLLRRSSVPRPLAILTSVACLSMTLWFDGSRVLLEPLFHLPILAAAILALGPETRRSAIFAGVAAGLAFLTKQYGGFGLLGLGLYVMLRGRQAWAWGLWILAGFLATIGAALGVMAAISVAPGDILSNAFSGNYPRRYETIWFQLFLWCCPLALPALAVPFLRGAWTRKEVRLAAAFGLASCAPFVFRQHQYYFLNPTPWIFLLFGIGATMLAERRGRGEWIRVGAALLLLSIPIRAAYATAPHLVTEWRSEQMRRARRMTLAWPAERPTLSFISPGYLPLTRYPSAAPKILGYRFLNECSAEELRAGFAGAGAAWLDPQSMWTRGADRAFQADAGTLEGQLAAHGFAKETVIEDRFELWTKR